jgi:hypothetical protein
LRNYPGIRSTDEDQLLRPPVQQLADPQHSVALERTAAFETVWVEAVN